VEGSVVARFVVAPDGSVKDPTILRSLNPACDAEALRVIGIMPRWEPGSHKGQLATVFYTLPILFKLSAPKKEGAASPKEIGREAAKKIEEAQSGDQTPSGVTVIVDGKQIPFSDLSSIAPETIESIQVNKDKEDPSKGTIIVTSKKTVVVTGK
jgi:TonB family protein